MKSSFTLLFFITTLMTSAQCWQKFYAGETNNMAIVEDGTLWTWGLNNKGQLGDGTTIQRYCPVQIGNSTWIEISAGGNHCMGIKSDGTLWTWGNNQYGQLGDGTLVNKSIPTRIGTAANWVKVTASYASSYAIKSDGSLWAWGENDTGELGIGNYTNRTIPTRVGLETNWASVSSYLAHAVALKTNGTLWTWGWNQLGQLGNGTNTDSSSPVEILPLETWQSASAGDASTYAIKTDGTLWSFGSNSYGALGVGSIGGSINYPFQIGNDTDWEKVSGGYVYAKAIKSDGSLWAWGSNGGKVFGIETIDNSGIPIHIGTESWQAVSCGNSCALELKTDGTLWGSGAHAALCDGLTTGYTPVLTNLNCPISLGIETNQQNKRFTIYPNPAQDKITILGDGLATYGKLKITDITGKELMVVDEFPVIDIQKLNTGIYILQLYFEGGSESHKFIKE